MTPLDLELGNTNSLCGLPPRPRHTIPRSALVAQLIYGMPTMLSYCMLSRTSKPGCIASVCLRGWGRGGERREEYERSDHGKDEAGKDCTTWVMEIAPPGPWVSWALSMGLCSESTEKLERSVNDLSVFSRPVHTTRHQIS